MVQCIVCYVIITYKTWQLKQTCRRPLIHSVCSILDGKISLPRTGHVLRKMKPLLELSLLSHPHLSREHWNDRKLWSLPFGLQMKCVSLIQHILTPNPMANPSHLYQVGTGLHRACPVVSALSDCQVGHQQVRRQLTGSECVVGGLQEGEAWHAAGIGLTFAQSQPVSMQPPA